MNKPYFLVYNKNNPTFIALGNEYDIGELNDIKIEIGYIIFFNNNLKINNLETKDLETKDLEKKDLETKDLNNNYTKIIVYRYGYSLNKCDNFIENENNNYINLKDEQNNYLPNILSLNINGLDVIIVNKSNNNNVNIYFKLDNTNIEIDNNLLWEKILLYIENNYGKIKDLHLINPLTQISI
jgi:hypothetical protein